MSNKPVRFDVITLFPESIQPYTDSSIISRAQEDGLVDIKYWQIRDFAQNQHHRVDQKPYGGGPGVVVEAPAVLRAWQAAKGRRRKVRTIFFSPHGRPFNQSHAIEVASAGDDFIFLCGRYEGIDHRVVEATKAEAVSIGPYVLTGGELPAAIMIDAITRQLPGVLGTYESLEEKRIASPKVYTRPEKFKFKGKDYSVPEVLRTGNHAEIDKWRQEQ